VKKLLFILLFLPVLAFGQHGMWANGWRHAVTPESYLLLNAGYEESNSLNTQSPALLTPEYRSSSEEKNSTAPYVAFERTGTVSRSGSWALLVRLDEDYPLDDRHRAERTFYNLATPIAEQWYRVSIFIPEDWEDDANTCQLYQFHSLDNPGDGAKIPALSCFVSSGQYDINIAWNSLYQSSGWHDEHFYPGAISGDKGTWVDWVIHARWDYRADSSGGNGLIEIWKNGDLVVNYNGACGYNDDLGVYFKWGLMKLGPWTFTSSEKIAYFDDVRVGTDDADYAEMMAVIYFEHRNKMGIHVSWVIHFYIIDKKKKYLCPILSQAV